MSTINRSNTVTIKNQTSFVLEPRTYGSSETISYIINQTLYYPSSNYTTNTANQTQYYPPDYYMYQYQGEYNLIIFSRLNGMF